MKEMFLEYSSTSSSEYENNTKRSNVFMFDKSLKDFPKQKLFFYEKPEEVDTVSSSINYESSDNIFKTNAKDKRSKRKRVLKRISFLFGNKNLIK